MPFIADPMAELNGVLETSYTAPLMGDAGGQHLIGQTKPNRPSSISNVLGGTGEAQEHALSWLHINSPGDVYKVEKKDVDSDQFAPDTVFSLLIDDVATKTHTRTGLSSRLEAEYNVYTKRGGVLSDVTVVTGIRTNTVITGNYKDTATPANPINNADVSAWREDTNVVINTSQTDVNGDYSIELDTNWPYKVTVFAEGPTGINGAIASGVQA